MPSGASTVASALFDPSTVQVINTGGSVMLVGGQVLGAISSATNDASAKIVNGGDIVFNISGATSVSVPGTALVAPPGLVVVGGAGTGLFGAGSKPINLGDEIKANFLGGGSYTILSNPGLADAAVIANSPRSYDQLLNYIIFAANEETRAAAIRGLMTDDTDLPACN
jgi:hypothetical protein